MNLEIQYLIYSAALGLAQILAGAGLSTLQRGVQWNLSARDSNPVPLQGKAARMERCLANFKETFPLFIDGVFAITYLQKTSSQTALASQIYFVARLLNIPLYIFGVPYLRTLVWAGATISICYLFCAALG